MIVSIDHRNFLCRTWEEYRDCIRELLSGYDGEIWISDSGLPEDLPCLGILTEGEKAIINYFAQDGSNCVTVGDKSNIFIGELQTGPDRLLKELSFSSARMIRLRPLMMVSGHHWNKDVAGEKTGSWRNVLLEAGYEVICEKEGLLGKNEIIDLLLGQKGLS